MSFRLFSLKESHDELRGKSSKNSIKSDHLLTVVFIDLEINKIKRGPGIFKLNKSLLLEVEYDENIQNATKDIKDYNDNANPLVSN